jgi:hypothetical protein
MARRGFVPTFLYITAGLIVWAVRFLFVYSFAGVACARGWADSTIAGFRVVPFVIVAATIVGVAVTSMVLLRAGRGVRRGQFGEERLDGFIHAVAALMAGLSILAMAWETIPAFTVPICP